METVFTVFGFAITYPLIWKAVRIALYIVVGFPLLHVIINMIMRSIKNYGNPHVRMLINKVLYYSGFTYLMIMLLREFGFQLTALLGAAGIFGVAIGFASQTSMSNLISGLFLLSEGFLAVGDLIECGGIKGVVQTIDLFSVKVKTFDDELVRIPNEQLIKNDLINITFFPNRRVNLEVAVSAQHSIKEVLAVLNEVADANELVVKKPAHDILMNSMSSSAIRVTLRAWTKNKNYLAVQKQLVPEIQSALQKHNIKMLYVITK